MHQRSTTSSPLRLNRRQPATAVMSAIREALEELDDTTLQLVIGFYLEDAALIESQGNNDDATSADDVAVSKIYSEELLQYQAIRHFEGEETRLAEASAVAVASAPPNVVCASCDDSYPSEEVWQASCSHHYRIECLEQLHRASMTDETLYPPRCCRQEMPWERQIKSQRQVGHSIPREEGRARYAHRPAYLLLECSVRKIRWSSVHCKRHCSLSRVQHVHMHYVQGRQPRR